MAPERGRLPRRPASDAGPRGGPGNRPAGAAEARPGADGPARGAARCRPQRLPPWAARRGPAASGLLEGRVTTGSLPAMECSEVVGELNRHEREAEPAGAA